MTQSSLLPAQENQVEVEAYPTSTQPGHFWWQQAAYYVGGGIRICRKDIPGLLTLVGLFMLPPLAAVIRPMGCTRRSAQGPR